MYNEWTMASMVICVVVCMLVGRYLVCMVAKVVQWLVIGGTCYNSLFYSAPHNYVIVFSTFSHSKFI